MAELDSEEYPPGRSGNGLMQTMQICRVQYVTWIIGLPGADKLMEHLIERTFLK